MGLGLRLGLDDVVFSWALSRVFGYEGCCDRVGGGGGVDSLLSEV